ncbi:RNAse P Rpr2/Rpp21 subunit [Macrophomina phaseolina MS6]|uniref:RNAse P Rpr2/Rpp21 subunit n=1 Tax=Macrophomina phaseolina (strain MS6) TaxID=1126212 RepID=K2S376_MACPH|nr:RNAse P Rpr2/Rpp21 subunit [Macrophomina phaseolina MS6]
MERSATEMREISARLKYLDEAAHLLALASPETSSFLESQYSYLLAENDLAGPPSRKKDVCNACGTILVPGISCTVKQEAVAPAKPTRKGGKVETPKVSKSSKMKIYSCSRCSSKTRLPIASNKARMNTPKSMKVSVAATSMAAGAGSARPTGSKSVPASNAAPPADAPATPAPAASNASSKKRAKARKGGLQALLANSKKDTSSSKGFGLDLMDLMHSE